VRRADLIVAALFVAVGLVTILVVVPRYVAASAAGGDLSPAFMPYVAACLATGAMALLFLTRLIGRTADADAPPLPARSWLFIGTAIALMAGAFALLDVFGYLAGAATLVAGFLLLVRAKIHIVLGAAVALPLALWLLFDKVLDFPLP
jgi:Tripartite tricarboxylate transporter TctB family